jgi:outer membrane protein assembly factor BamD (BamD/ComL family)
MHEEYQQCIDLLSQLATTYPDNAHGAESRLLQARALVALARFEDAAAVLDDLLTRFPGSHYIPSALLLRGDALFSTPGASADTARQSYLAAAAHVGASAAQKLECAYKVARCMLRLGEKDEDVLRQYQDHVIAPCMELLDKGDGLDARSGEWYAKSIFEVSEIEVKRGHLDSAITLLERLASSRLPDADRARDRIRQLREESWRTPAPASP